MTGFKMPRQPRVKSSAAEHENLRALADVKIDVDPGDKVVSVIRLLQPLSDADRRRVLNSVAAYFQVKQPWDE